MFSRVYVMFDACAQTPCTSTPLLTLTATPRTASLFVLYHAGRVYVSKGLTVNMAQTMYPRATVKKIVKAHANRPLSKNVDILVSYHSRNIGTKHLADNRTKRFSSTTRSSCKSMSSQSRPILSIHFPFSNAHTDPTIWTYVELLMRMQRSMWEDERLICD